MSCLWPEKIACVEVMGRGEKAFPLTYIPGKFVVLLAGGEENKKWNCHFRSFMMERKTRIPSLKMTQRKVEVACF